MLRGLGRDDEAMTEDLCALELTANEADRSLLRGRLGL
jgi:RNA polymerase sigma-70 factor (ECF subfamily)